MLYVSHLTALISHSRYLLTYTVQQCQWNKTHGRCHVF